LGGKYEKGNDIQAENVKETGRREKNKGKIKVRRIKLKLKG
jgi:hypothetical protein